MIRSTVAAGKGQLLKASTRAVPLGSVADHSIPHHEGTSIALVQEVIEAKGGHGEVLNQDGHVIYHNPSNENIDFGQGAAKISEVKVGVRKKYLPTRSTTGAWVRTRPLGRYFS